MNYILIAMVGVMILASVPWYIMGVLSLFLEIYTTFCVYTAWSYVTRLKAGDLSMSTYGQVDLEKSQAAVLQITPDRYSESAGIKVTVEQPIMNGRPAHEDEDMFNDIVGSEVNSPKNGTPGSRAKKILQQDEKKFLFPESSSRNSSERDQKELC